MARSRHLTFGKEEKLCSVKIIESLIRSKKSIQNQPFRLIWDYYPLPSPVAVQIVFVVPKKNIRLAVNRNRIRRQMREVYRLNKPIIDEILVSNDKQVAMMLFFTGKKQMDFKDMESKIILILQRFGETIHANLQ